MKLFSFYFPQFYPIPENDKAWGAGFTDWDNVRSASPLFKGHHQPRVPLDGYYDQSKPETIARQVSDMKRANLDGVSFYHYWFDGKVVLEKPAENFLNNRDLDVSFNFTWANETWSKRWIGKDNDIIFQQNHTDSKELWKKHFEYLLPFFKDERYYKVNNCPVFNIYNPHLIKNHDLLFKYWNDLAIKEGFNGVHFVAVLASPSFSVERLEGYSGCLDFQPRFSANSLKIDNNKLFGGVFDKLRYLPEPILNQLTKIRHRYSGVTYINYKDAWDNIFKISNQTFVPNTKRYYSAFLDWDNTPRYKDRATIYKGASIKAFISNLENLLSMLQDEDSLIYINAWNEWSEGTYIEADEENADLCIQELSKLRGGE
ncbi:MULTISPECIES: glycoside hydrolase family 99-like domain-containing protein [Vibrio]|uniref:glycosyltransferase WbsX family protein n=1 Tax=Vibrio TaxID=662 RepID=UPI00107F03D3|nr:glycoside hydrolase family 99-like domain-containing protein [Vibrio tasmaniensis]